MLATQNGKDFVSRLEYQVIEIFNRNRKCYKKE